MLAALYVSEKEEIEIVLAALYVSEKEEIEIVQVVFIGDN